ncbi:type II toxin-antitoxin system prevent-host-death family antitoxin [Thiomicrorhabdus hydrogeniphila]
MQQVTFSDARSHFKEVCSRAVDDQDALLVTRRDAENVVLMPQSLFESWQETIYLLKSPANADMLARSIEQHQKGQTLKHELVKTDEA